MVERIVYLTEGEEGVEQEKKYYTKERERG